MHFWLIALFLPFLVGCGSESPAPASPTSLTDTPVSSAPTEPVATDRELPPGPPIGTFVQPKDIIVMAERDATIPFETESGGDSFEEPDLQDKDVTSLGKAINVAKVADVIADDTSGWFTRYGPTNCSTNPSSKYYYCWKEASTGYSGHMWWTYNNSSTTTSYAIWDPYLQCSGVFSLSAYIPGSNATTSNAKYTITHAYGTSAYNISQINWSNTWVGMGSYTFTNSAVGVKLIDATGETMGNWRVGFDAMKWTWQSATASLQVTSPNGGETLYKSGCIPIYWNSSGLSDNVRIHLYRYGSIVKGLTNSTSNDGYECISASLFSDVSDGGGYTIGMSNVNSYCDGTTSDFSNGSFSIYTPSLTVNSPNGGESYMGTGSMGINWSSTAVSGNVRIQLCQYGSCNITIHDNASNTGSYNWNILNISGSGYRIRITSVNNSSLWDESNSNFTITAPPPPVVTISTNGGGDFTTTVCSVQIIGTCTDGNNDIDWIRYNNSATGWNTTDYGPSGGYYNFGPTINLTSGANPIQVSCQDMTGALSSDSITVTCTPVGGLSGTVTNNSGSTLSNAVVTAIGPITATTSTNSSGQFGISGLPPGTYDVKANTAGHIDQIKTVSVSAGNTTVVNFVLTKIPAPIFYYSPNSLSVTMNSGNVNGTQSFVVKNNGDATLTYTPSSNVNWASIQKNGATVTGTQLSLAPTAQDTLTVIFNSNGIAGPSSQSGTITITHNDGSQSAKTVSLGMGINAPPPQPPAPAEQPAPSTPAFQPAMYGQCPVQNACYADPVNTAIGNYTYDHTDLAIDARGPPLIFTRYYNSLDATEGPLGLGWNHSLNSQVIATSTGDAYIRWGNGRTDKYTWDGSGFTPPAGVFTTLTKGGQYILTDKEQNVWAFSTEGQLQSVTDRHNNKLTLAYDSQKRLVTATNAVGDVLTLNYVSATDSKLQSVSDASGRSIQFTYNGSLLSQVKDARGNNFGFLYDAGNRLKEVTERDGKLLVTNTYDGSGRVTIQKDGLQNQTNFAYDTPSPGKTTVTDPAGQTHIYSYDALFRLISHKGPDGKSVSNLYNTYNQTTQWTDANGNATLYTYDANGNLKTMTNPLGGTTQWTYDSLNRVETFTNPMGLITTFAYDTAGDLDKASFTLDGVLHEIYYDYYPTGEIKTVTDALGFITTYNYNAKGELSSVTNAENKTTSFTYDDLHRLSSVTDPLLRKWSYTKYDANDNLETITNPLDKSENRVFDFRDRIASITDPTGTTTWIYDDAGRLWKATDPAGTTTYGYNTINQRTSVTNPANATTTFDYTPLGYLKKITDPTGRSVNMTIDSMGHVEDSTDSAGKVTDFTLNKLGQPTDVKTPTNNVHKFSYNAAGLVKSFTDPDNFVFTTNYDNLERVSSVTNPLQGVVKKIYDKNGRLTSLTTPAGPQMSWTYDKIGRMTEVTSPGGKKQILTYDAAGQLDTIKNANNQTTTLSYDAAGRPTTTTFADGVKRTFDYYPDNGFVKQITEGTWVRSFTYDSAGRISTCTDPWNKTIGYTYTPAGQIASISYPGGKSVGYIYDSAGRMSSVTDTSGGTTIYTYDSAGRLQKATYPNGVTTTYGYDDASRVSTITHKKSDSSTFLSLMAEYDARDNITSVERTPEPTHWVPTATTDYSVNNEDQYTQVESELLGYDAVGQTLSRNLSGTIIDYTFDARERLTAVSGTNPATFIYGSLGERIQKTAGSTVTRYVVDTNDGLPRVLVEMDGNNAITAYYTYGIGLVARVPATGSEVRYYHEDFQSNITALTNASGVVTDTYVYHPFGKVLGKTGTSANPYQFAGKLGVEQDETGLIYMRARYYDSALGRFISKDPIGISGGLNLYDYVAGNPMSSADPSGLIAMFFEPLLLESGGIYVNPAAGSFARITLPRLMMEDAGKVYIPKPTIEEPISISRSSIPSELVDKPMPRGTWVHRYIENLERFADYAKESRVKNAQDVTKGIRDMSKPGEQVEIKPNNTRAIKNGFKQLDRYSKLDIESGRIPPSISKILPYDIVPSWVMSTYQFITGSSSKSGCGINMSCENYSQVMPSGPQTYFKNPLTSLSTQTEVPTK